MGRLYGAFPDRWWRNRWWTADQLPGHILIVILGTFLLMMFFLLFIKNLIHSDGGTIRMPSIPVSAFVGTFTGWDSSMMGVAGGASMVPFMISYVTPVRYAIGTASALGIPTAFAGAISLSSVSARLGAWLAHFLDQKLLQRLFATFLAVLSARLIWRHLG